MIEQAIVVGALTAVAGNLSWIWVGERLEFGMSVAAFIIGCSVYIAWKAAIG